MTAKTILAIEHLAREIASDLFVNGQGERCQRLVLTIDGPPARNIGGWSESAVAFRIERMLRANVIDGVEGAQR
jgi:hypothetical protein